MKRFSGADRSVLGYIALMSVAVAVRFPHIPHAERYLAYHAAAALFVWLLATAERARPGGLWRILHVWYPMYLLPAAFRELHYLIPHLHPHGLEFDYALLAVDTRLFGDVRAHVEVFNVPAITAALHVCYWMYISFPVLHTLGLSIRGRWDEAREDLSVLVFAWLTSYALYCTVPAYGPYVIEPGPAPGWQDGSMSLWMHRTLLEIEWKTADAFPSGHVLVLTLSLWMMARRQRGLFWLMLLPGVGLALATVVLRYHYAIDLVASWLLVPAVIYAGRLLHRRAAAGPASSSP